jgi:hypothetical protein
MASLLVIQSAYAMKLCKDQRRLRVAEQLARLKPSTDLDIFDFEPFPGGSAAIGYEYDVTPAYTKGLYSRSDSWFIKTSLVPSKTVEIEEGMSPKFSGGVNNKIEATFIRFMKDPCRAMLALPYAPTMMPITAKNAIDHRFKEGDYFLLRGSVGYVVSAEILKLLGTSGWGASFSGGFLMDGYYQLHIVRLGKNQIRLKVVAQRGKSLRASLGLGYDTEFEVFGISKLDDQLEKFVMTNPIKIGAAAGDSGVFMVDYILDLSDKEVAWAFEQVLRKVKEFKSIQYANPFKKKNDLEDSMLLDLTPLEDLFRRDYQGDAVGRIKRNLRTASDQRTYGINLKLGNRLIGASIGGNRSKAQIRIRQPDESLEHYVLRSWDTETEGRLLYNWQKTEKKDGFRTLSESDKNFESLNPINFIKTIGQKKNRFSYNNFKKLKYDLKKFLPTELFSEIPWSTWDQSENDKMSNFGLRFLLVMNPQVLNELPSLSKGEVRELFRDHVFSKGFGPRDFYSDSNDGKMRTTAEQQFDLALLQLSKYLSMALNGKETLENRIQLIARLRHNTLFNQVGTSFLMILRPDLMAKFFHVDLDISSSEEEIDYSFGDASLATLYKKILIVKAALDDDGLVSSCCFCNSIF